MTLLSTIRPVLPTKVPEGLDEDEAIEELRGDCAEYFLGGCPPIRTSDPIRIVSHAAPCHCQALNPRQWAQGFSLTLTHRIMWDMRPKFASCLVFRDGIVPKRWAICTCGEDRSSMEPLLKSWARVVFWELLVISISRKLTSASPCNFSSCDSSVFSLGLGVGGSFIASPSLLHVFFRSVKSSRPLEAPFASFVAWLCVRTTTLQKCRVKCFFDFLCQGVVKLAWILVKFAESHIFQDLGELFHGQSCTFALLRLQRPKVSASPPAGRNLPEIFHLSHRYWCEHLWDVPVRTFFLDLSPMKNEDVISFCQCSPSRLNVQIWQGWYACMTICFDRGIIAVRVFLTSLTGPS